MATSGIKHINVTSYDDMFFSWETKSQSTENNTSTIYWKAELVSYDYGRISSTASKKYTCIINGKTYSGTNTVGIGENATKILASGTVVIPHNTDGTKTFSFSYEQEFGITFSDKHIGTKIISGNGELNDINRIATVSAANATIGSMVRLSFGNVDSAFEYNLSYVFNGATGTIASNMPLETTYFWIPSDSLHTAIPNAKSANCVIKCETLLNGSVIGSNTTTIVLSANSTVCKPTVTATITDSNTQTTLLTGNNKKFVKYQSNANYLIGAMGKYGATIKSYKATCEGVSYTTQSGVFNKVSKNTITVAATDSRGYTTTIEYTLDFIDYINLSCKVIATPPTTSGVAKLNISGNYFDGMFREPNPEIEEDEGEKNVLIIVYRYKVNDGSYTDWTSSEATIIKSGGTYAQEVEISGLNYENTYTFQARAADKILTRDSNEHKVKTTPVFDWGANDFSFNVPVYVKEGAGFYNIGKIGKAFSTSLGLATTATAGANYTSCNGSATLLGNNLRCYINCAGRSAASGSGDIANEIVATMRIEHGGKISSAYATSFVTGSIGSVACFTIMNATNAGGVLTFDISLTAAATGLTNFSTYFVVPCTLNFDAY